MMLDRNFDPGFRIELHIKDLTNAQNASKAVGMELPMTDRVLDMMKNSRKRGLENVITQRCSVIMRNRKI